MENKTIVEIVIRVIDGKVSVNGAKEQAQIAPIQVPDEPTFKRKGRVRKLKRRSDFDKRFKEEKFTLNTVGRPRHKKRKTDK